MRQDRTPRISVENIQAWLALTIKHFRLVLLLMCLVWAIGLAFYVFKRPVYGAKALFLVKSEGKVLSQEEFFSDTDFFYILSTIHQPYMLEKIAASLGIEADYETIQRRYFKKVRARKRPPTGETGIREIEVSVYTYSNDLVTRWLDAALKVYYEERARRRRDDRLKTIADCRDEMARMQAEMNAFADKQEAFRERTGWTDICAEWNEYEGVPRRLEEVERRLDFLQSLQGILGNTSLSVVERLSILSARGWPRSGPQIGQVFAKSPPLFAAGASPQGETGEAATADLPQQEQAPMQTPGWNRSGMEFVVVPGMQGVSPGGWDVLYQEKMLLEQERAKLGRTYLPGHPKMRELMARLDEVDANLEEKFATAKGRVDWESFILQQEREELQAKLPQVDAVRQRYEAVMEQFVQLKYGHLPWKEKYNELLEKLSIAKMELDYGSSAPDSTEIVNMGYTHVPELPVSPHRGKLLLFCLFLGVVLSTGAVFAVEYMDRTVAYVESAEGDLGLRGLGIVPLVPHRAIPQGAKLLVDSRIGEDGHQRSLVETFRIIRANLLSGGPAAGPRQVLMVTSSLPREGKSAVSTNLSLALARAGKKTLLIDADARRGRLLRELGIQGPGLSDVLSGGIAFEDACNNTDEPNLQVMGIGHHATGLPELLASPSFTEGLNRMRQTYDHILIDTPPVLGLSEACDLLPVVDGVILVIWAKYTPLSEVKASLSLLKANRANLLGFVLNRVDLSNASYYYHYYYYSNYYYRSYNQQRLPEAGVSTVET